MFYSLSDYFVMEYIVFFCEFLFYIIYILDIVVMMYVVIGLLKYLFVVFILIIVMKIGNIIIIEYKNMLELLMLLYFCFYLYR